jgi:O-Antigen ligase
VLSVSLAWLLAVAGVAALAGAAFLVAGWVSKLAGWAPAGPLVLLAATPLVPFVPLARGLSLDDVVPVTGLLLLGQAIGWRPGTAWPFRLLLCLGLGVALLAALVSAVANAASPLEAIELAIRGAGRLAFLAAIAVTVAAVSPGWRKQEVIARALAVVGVVEAAVGLIAYALVLPPGIGLEATRKHSVLHHQVPGRINGTLALAADHLGAVFVFTIPLTAALAVQSRQRRSQTIWWSAVLVQFLALLLTYTRSSLALVVAVLVALLAARARLRLLLPIMVLLLLVLLTTPTLERFVNDVPDRFALWTSASRLMAAHPFTGVGPGRELEAAKSDPAHYQDTPYGPAVSTAHNTVLLAGAETGLLGAAGIALLNVGLGLAALRLVVRNRRPGRPVLPFTAGLAILAFLAQGMVNNLLTVGVTGTLAATMVGCFLAGADAGPADRPEASPGDRPETQPARAVRAPGWPWRAISTLGRPSGRSELVRWDIRAGAAEALAGFPVVGVRGAGGR